MHFGSKSKLDGGSGSFARAAYVWLVLVCVESDLQMISNQSDLKRDKNGSKLPTHQNMILTE